MRNIKLDITAEMISEIVSTPEFIAEQQTALSQIDEPKSMKDMVSYINQLEKAQFLLGMKAMQLIYENILNCRMKNK